MRKFLDFFFTGKFERFCAGSGTAGSRIGIKNADESMCVLTFEVFHESFSTVLYVDSSSGSVKAISS